jgi:hypothetical protein
MQLTLHAASSGAIVGASSSDETMILSSFKCAKAASPEPAIDLVNRRTDEQLFPGGGISVAPRMTWEVVL